jgi:hypothetical protein
VGETVPISAHLSGSSEAGQPELPVVGHPTPAPLPIIEAFELLCQWFESHYALNTNTSAGGPTSELIAKLKAVVAHLKGGE